MVNWTALIVFIVLFAFVTVLGFVAARWRRGDLNQLNEWGLGGRRFGTVVTWFLLGGDLYTAYTFIAVPALVFATGASGFFALPYTIIAYPFVFLVMPRLWSVAHKHGYITPADFVRGRYGSGLLGLAVAITGILATMPYIALQLVGIQVVIAAMGIRGNGALAQDLPLIIAFVILAAYTYTSGLRAPAMIALVKDALIYIAVLAAVIIIPAKLGGYGAIFHTAAVHEATKPATSTFSLILQGVTQKGGVTNVGQMLAYSTLALGSALALFLYPHSVTGVLSSNSRNVIKRNAALLPAYSFLLGLVALLGFMALAAHVNALPQFSGAPFTTVVKGKPTFNNNYAVPALFLSQFPDWFVGIAFAAIAIGALVPAAIMSIGASNLFTRNIYKEYIRPNATEHEEATVAKTVSLIIKFGALLFIITNQAQFAIQLQLLGGVWIIQTLPALVIGLYTRFFHRWALLIGWAVGMVAGTWMYYSQSTPSTTYPLHVGSYVLPGYAALYTVILNLIVTAVLTVVFRMIHVPDGRDETAPHDFEEVTPDVITPAVAGAGE